MADPSATFVDRTTAYVRGNLLLRGLALMTGLNVFGGALLAFFGTLRWDMVGYLVLLSLFTWFFAVGLPVLNRAVREQAGADPRSYWGSVVERFARVVLCAQTGLHAAILIYAALGLFPEP